MLIRFFQEDIGFDLKEKDRNKKWLKEIIHHNKFRLKNINYIFCSDEYLFQINRDYLGHETYTDIITFDNSENLFEIEGDIYISIDRIKENSIKENVSFEKELRRVMSHGLLHLMGYRDKNKKDKEKMREMEDLSLLIFEKI